MGLAQREFEAAGFSTICLSPIPIFTASVGVPRIAGIEHPFGRLFGQPGDAEGQTAVLRATMRVLTDAGAPGTVEDLPFQWAERRSAAIRHSKEAPPIAKLMKRKPWLLPKLISGDIPE